MDGLLIGELARRTGTNAKTIRYYESVGLLSSPSRNDSGYRQYASTDVERLQFVKSAQQLGLSLSEIKDIVSIWDSGQAPCGQVSRLLDEKLAQLDERIAAMTRFRRELATFKARIDSSSLEAGVPCRHVAAVTRGEWQPFAPAERLALAPLTRVSNADCCDHSTTAERKA